MFCTKCGHKNPDDAVFCDGCGNRLEEIVDGSAEEKGVVDAKVVEKSESDTSLKVPEVKKGKKKLDKNGRIGLVVIFALVLIGLILFKKPSVNFNNYLDISIEGYDGYATASYSIDKEKFYEDTKNRIKPTVGGKKLAASFNGKERFAKALIENYIEVTIDPEDGLANGDEVVANIKVDEKAILEDFGIKVKASDVKKPVMNLVEANMIDLFKYISFETKGIAPEGHLEVKISDDCPFSSYIVETLLNIEKKDGLSNGDEVVIGMNPIVPALAEECLEDYGGIPYGKEFTYTVEGLGAYVTKETELTDACFSKIDEQFKDVLIASYAEKTDGNMSLNSMERLGYYLLIPKEKVYNDTMLYVVYKVNASIWVEETAFSDTIEYYTYLKYRDPIYVDGESPLKVDVINAGMPGNMQLRCYDDNSSRSITYYISGERNLDDMYREVVTSKVNQFVTKSTVQ